MSLLLKLIDSRYVTGGIIVIMLSLAGFAAIQSYRLNSSHTRIAAVEAKLAEERANNQICQSNVTHLGNSINSQNRAVKNYSEQSKKLIMQANRRAVAALQQPIKPLPSYGSAAMNQWINSK